MRTRHRIKLAEVPALPVIPLNRPMLIVPFQSATIRGSPTWAEPTSGHRRFGANPDRARKAWQRLSISWRKERPRGSPCSCRR